jgi:hypothetical protein
MSEFQAFKHMECIIPGMLQRASDPLEVQLRIQPTMVLLNALPYEMRVLLWQVLPDRDPSISPGDPRSPRHQPGPQPQAVRCTCHRGVHGAARRGLLWQGGLVVRRAAALPACAAEVTVLEHFLRRLHRSAL